MAITASAAVVLRPRCAPSSLAAPLRALSAAASAHADASGPAPSAAPPVWPPVRLWSRPRPRRALVAGPPHGARWLSAAPGGGGKQDGELRSVLESSSESDPKSESESESAPAQAAGAGAGPHETDPDRNSAADPSLVMNPRSKARLVLPGGFVMKKNSKTGAERRILAERAMGFFWQITDLNESGNKPILASPRIIPASEARLFPPLGAGGGASNLLGEPAELPAFFTRNNRARDPTARCTLVALSFKDFGDRMLPGWIDPFEAAFSPPNGDGGDGTSTSTVGDGSTR